MAGVASTKDKFDLNQRMAAGIGVTVYRITRFFGRSNGKSLTAGTAVGADRIGCRARRIQHYLPSLVKAEAILITSRKIPNKTIAQSSFRLPVFGNLVKTIIVSRHNHLEGAS
jgi:hypothetical protein